MDEADLSRMNDIELQKEYGRMKARLSKDGGRDPEGYRRLEAVSEEMDRRRRAVREEYFRDLREETGPLSPLGMECYVCGRTVEQFNDFVRRNAEADFDLKSSTECR